MLSCVFDTLIPIIMSRSRGLESNINKMVAGCIDIENTREWEIKLQRNVHKKVKPSKTLLFMAADIPTLPI